MPQRHKLDNISPERDTLADPVHPRGIWFLKITESRLPMKSKLQRKDPPGCVAPTCTLHHRQHRGSRPSLRSLHCPIFTDTTALPYLQMFHVLEWLLQVQLLPSCSKKWMPLCVRATPVSSSCCPRTTLRMVLLRFGLVSTTSAAFLEPVQVKCCTQFRLVGSSTACRHSQPKLVPLMNPSISCNK